MITATTTQRGLVHSTRNMSLIVTSHVTAVPSMVVTARRLPRIHRLFDNTRINSFQVLDPSELRQTRFKMLALLESTRLLTISRGTANGMKVPIRTQGQALMKEACATYRASHLGVSELILGLKGSHSCHEATKPRLVQRKVHVTIRARTLAYVMPQWMEEGMEKRLHWQENCVRKELQISGILSIQTETSPGHQVSDLSLAFQLVAPSELIISMY